MAVKQPSGKASTNFFNLKNLPYSVLFSHLKVSKRGSATPNGWSPLRPWMRTVPIECHAGACLHSGFHAAAFLLLPLCTWHKICLSNSLNFSIASYGEVVLKPKPLNGKINILL
ncbi:hypothetical protein T02_15335 [Trichinella nativa]|uniref:Uncharacterized protein n=1 Tax=Trichinella nativa TaxID=6335 RepID=A0A0V1LDY7_9BILA|nr:hypothetical protein T02_15335 [Trichinella nativa]